MRRGSRHTRFTPGETASGMQCWVVSAASLDALEKDEFRYSYRKSNQDSLVVWSTTYSFTMTGKSRVPPPKAIGVKNGVSGVDCEMN